ncbi:MAG: hypothetical protein ABI863_17385 [Ginsengibacter sp.]
MKKLIIITSFMFLYAGLHAQDAYTQQMQSAVTKLDAAKTTNDYEQLAINFMQIASSQKTQWLPDYYAAFCNAKIGWLKQNTDPDNIEAFANKSLEQIATAKSLLDTSKQKKELSEVYCIFSMANRAMVFINPMSNGRKYGPAAAKYITLAEQENPDNPRALYLDAWQKITTPKLWGGDKTEGKQLLNEAKQKLESNPSTGVEPHWGKTEIDDMLKKLK